jgi:hypothetical protein
MECRSNLLTFTRLMPPGTLYHAAVEDRELWIRGSAGNLMLTAQLCPATATRVMSVRPCVCCWMSVHRRRPVEPMPIWANGRIVSFGPMAFAATADLSTLPGTCSGAEERPRPRSRLGNSEHEAGRYAGSPV